MWEVVAQCQHTGRERKVVTVSWERAKLLTERALDMTWKVTVRQYFSDVLLADSTGVFYQVRSRLTPREAADYSIAYAKQDRERGCLLWPHGRPIPEGWRVVRFNDGEVA